MVSVIEKYVSGNAKDAQEKINNCLALYKGEWVYIRQYVGGRAGEVLADVQYIDPKYGGRRDHVNLAKTKEEDFSLGPYPLGFIRHRNALYYTARAPVRKNRFGLRDDNMSWTLVSAEPTVQPDGRLRGPGLTEAWQGGSLFPLLIGDFNPEQRIKEIAAGETYFAPIARDFAIVRVSRSLCSLYYKTEVAGEFDLTTKKLSLYPSFEHLKERVALTLKGF